MAAALMFSMFTPDGLTLRDCLLGGVTGLVILLPFYLMGGMGASGCCTGDDVRGV
jgi:Flp pilus assembly protein protease CpaA